MQRKQLTGLSALLIAFALTTATAEEAAVVVSDAWIREAPPGVSMLAGYFTVTNHGEARVTLSGARSGRFGAVEMHQTQIIDGVARMRRLELIDVPPGDPVEFAPGGRHLMLFDPRDMPGEGDCVPVTLLLDDGGEIEARFQVLRP